MDEREKQYHTLQPIYDKNSKVLILGSFPSVKSREIGFYYGHKQNRFWKVMEELFSTKLTTIDDKKNFLLREHIALFDVISSCKIVGSSDSKIEEVEVNDISLILNSSCIKAIFINGKKAFSIYNKYLLPITKIEARCLPSTSPANASWNIEKLVEVWKEIKEVLKS